LSVLHPWSDATWDTSYEVTHFKISPQQAHLTVDFSRMSSSKMSMHLLVIWVATSNLF